MLEKSETKLASGGRSVQTADRLQKIPPYLFVTLRNKINKARAAGIDVISLGVGDPVDPTPQSVIDELCRQAQVPINHQYPIDEEKGMLAFRQEVARWYSRKAVTISSWGWSTPGMWC
jgi:LL-diaminopimelate aminotransferase